MLSRLKRVIGSSSSEGHEDKESTEPVIDEYRLVYRAFVDDNGWEILMSWNTWEIERSRDLPVTREEFRSILRPDHWAGHYKLFRVDELNQMRGEVWGIEYRNGVKPSRNYRQSNGEEDESEDGSFTVTPEMWNRMQEAMDSIEWPEEE